MSSPRFPLLLVVGALALLVACPAQGPIIHVDPAAVEFGEVQLLSTVAQQISVQNDGDAPATLVFRMSDAGPFVVALGAPIELAAGDVRLISVETTPLVPGEAVATLQILWADAVLDVELSVIGVPAGDADGDGFTDDDCDDADAAVHPGAEEVCDGVDNDCSGAIDDTEDADDDGVFACDDCDDADLGNFPGNEEICDGADNNCDDAVDEGFDADGDGVRVCDEPPDCDDANGDTYPGADETCNGIDDDCDGDVDDGFADADADGESVCTDCDDDDSDAFHGNIEVCDGVDNDCDGTVDESVDLDGDGHSACTDCDDANGSIHPGATEVCDGIDQNCDSEADDGFDSDADGVLTCGPDLVDGNADDDCDDGDDTVYPGAPELCDGLDNDCDGEAENVGDLDGDGQTTCAGDCDDTDPDNFDGNPEVCDGQDNDCGGDTDEGFDVDGDGQTTCDGDCDDGDEDNYAGNSEVCDGQDNDCGGDTDEGFDGDADGATSCGPDGIASTTDDDCDDGNSDAYPGAPETCLDLDDLDCDAIAPEACGSCAEVLADVPGALDGVFEIDTDGSAGPLAPIDVLCDMTTDGGGWTLIQRTTDDGAANLALTTAYATVYDVDAGDPATGDPLRLSARHWEALAQGGDLMVRHDLRKADTSSCDPLRYALFGGALGVPAPSAGTAPSFAYAGADDHWIVNNQASPAVFSATDVGPSQSCSAPTNYGVPWFYAGCGWNLPSIAWVLYPASAPRPVIKLEALGAGLDGYDEDTACGGDAVELPLPDRAAENLHEYYLR